MVKLKEILQKFNVNLNLSERLFNLSFKENYTNYSLYENEDSHNIHEFSSDISDILIDLDDEESFLSYVLHNCDDEEAYVMIYNKEGFFSGES